MRLIILAIVVAFIGMSPAHAQSTRYIQALERINKINSYRPDQSPRHERSREVISDRVLDNQNRVVGEVRDIVLNRNGSIAMLYVEFDRLRLSTDKLMVSYPELGIRPVSNGYKMNYTDDQIADLVPELLANVETASGDDADTYSLKKLLGRKIYAEDGRTLGKIEDVLFDSLGGRAELLYINLSYKALRGDNMALPFGMASYKGKRITVNNDVADAMINFAENE